MLGKLLRGIREDHSRADRQKRSAEAYDQGHAALARGDAAAALGHFRAAAEAWGDNLEALANQAVCHAMLLQNSEAERCLAEVLRRAPEGPLAAPAHMNLGNLALAGQRYTAACRHYEAALNFDARSGPPNPDLLNNLGIAEHRRGFADR